MNSTDKDSSSSSNPYATPQTDLGHSRPNFSHHPLAGRFKRLVAIAIDMGILFLVEMLILLAFDAIFQTNSFNEFWEPDEDDTYWIETGLLEPLGYLSAATEMLIFFTLNGYFLATRGQSLGKMAMNIVIVDAKSTELSSFPNLFLFRYFPFWGTMIIGNLYQNVLVSHAELVEEERRCPMGDPSEVTGDCIHFAGFVPAS